MSTRKRVAITGATGYVGQFVSQTLAAAGWQVTALSRTPQASGHLAVEHWLTGDLSDPSQCAALLQSLLREQDAVVHCALSHVPGHYRGGEGNDASGFWQDNLTATVALLEAASDQGVPRAILLSTRAVFDGLPAQATLIADDAAVRPTTHYGALKATEEALARAYSTGPELAVSSLRLTGVYGCIAPMANSKWHDLLVQALTDPGSVTARCATEVHGDDVAAAIALLLGAPAGAIAGKVFNCSDVLLSRRVLLEMAAEHSGQPLPLPEAGQPPEFVLDCEGLRALGWQPGGMDKVRATVAQLLDALS